MTPQDQIAQRAAQGARTTLDQVQRRAKGQQNRQYRERVKREKALAAREAAVQAREDAIAKQEDIERFALHRLFDLHAAMAAGWSKPYLADKLADIIHELKSKMAAPKGGHS